MEYTIRLMKAQDILGLEWNVPSCIIQGSNDVC